MGIALGASIVYLPDTGEPYPTLLDFLAGRFPKIPKQIWHERILTGKVSGEDGQPIKLRTPYLPNQRLFYFREVVDEPTIPFQEQLLFIDRHLLVACKPHFLPVTPGGSFASETLINRLKIRTGNLELSPINRIDRDTAGLVLISANRKTRGIYQHLFMQGKIQKTYEAVTSVKRNTGRREWLVENRLEQGSPWFRMATCPGPVNARTRIQLVKRKGDFASFELFPLTGKKHQLRVHLSELGFPIVNERYYPSLCEEKADDFDSPLQLLAKSISFCDPVSGKNMHFISPRQLSSF